MVAGVFFGPRELPSHALANATRPDGSSDALEEGPTLRTVPTTRAVESDRYASIVAHVKRHHGDGKADERPVATQESNAVENHGSEAVLRGDDGAG